MVDLTDDWLRMQRARKASSGWTRHPMAIYSCHSVMASKSTKHVTNALEQTSTVRERLLAELGNLASALESGSERDIETGKKRVQQGHKVLADAVKQLDRSIKSAQRERAPSGAAGDEDIPDIDQLVREVYEAVLRELELFRQRAADPWLYLPKTVL